MLVVQLRQEALAPPSVCRVQGVGTADKKAVGGGKQGLWVGAPKGARGQAAMGRQSTRGGRGILRDHEGGFPGRGKSDRANGGGGSVF